MGTILFQYYQRVCPSIEGRAQGVFIESAITATQGEVTECVPPTAGLLRGTVPRKGPQSHRTCKSHTFLL